MMPSENTIRIAIELSVSSWLVAARLPGGEKSRLYRIEGGDTATLLARINELRSQVARKSRQTVEVACCFEAGRDGFWLHRWLTAHGVVAHVLEADAEDHGDAEQRGQRGKQLAALDLRQQRGR